MSDESVFVPIPWEARNLGIPSFAVTESFLENSDESLLIQALEEKKQFHQSFFVQARVSKKNLASCAILERHNFYFIESVLDLHFPIAKNRMLDQFIAQPEFFVPNRIQYKDLHFSEHKQLSQEDYNALKEVAYDSFIDDRFHRDKNCAPEIASQRFTHWIDDLVGDSESIFYILKYKSDTAGFGAFKNNIFSLVGLTRNYANKGLGEYIGYSCLLRMKLIGYTGVIGRVSVNNIPVINASSRIGGRFKNPKSTFHYWSNAEV